MHCEMWAFGLWHARVRKGNHLGHLPPCLNDLCSCKVTTVWPRRSGSKCDKTMYSRATFPADRTLNKRNIQLSVLEKTRNQKSHFYITWLCVRLNSSDLTYLVHIELSQLPASSFLHSSTSCSSASVLQTRGFTAAGFMHTLQKISTE